MRTPSSGSLPSPCCVWRCEWFVCCVKVSVHANRFTTKQQSPNLETYLHFAGNRGDRPVVFAGVDAALQAELQRPLSMVETEVHDAGQGAKAAARTQVSGWHAVQDHSMAASRSMHMAAFTSRTLIRCCARPSCAVSRLWKAAPLVPLGPNVPGASSYPYSGPCGMPCVSKKRGREFACGESAAPLCQITTLTRLMLLFYDESDAPKAFTGT
jgi:hypothetical protein